MTNQKRKKRRRLTPPKLGDPNETQADLPDTGTNASLPRKKPYFAHCRKNAARRKRERQTTEQKQRGRKKERDKKKLTKKRKKEEEKLFGRLATKL